MSPKSRTPGRVLKTAVQLFRLQVIAASQRKKEGGSGDSLLQFKLLQTNWGTDVPVEAPEAHEVSSKKCCSQAAASSAQSVSSGGAADYFLNNPDYDLFDADFDGDVL